MSDPARDAPTEKAAPVVVKKYANRRLYNTESSSYITLENLAEMIRQGRDFVVYDAKTGEDITRQVLTQIIVEEEGKGAAMLPTSFLRQLIGLYGEDMQGLVPRYLEQAMNAFARQQEQMRAAMQQTMDTMLPRGMGLAGGLPGGLPANLEEMGRQNMAMMERAMSLFSPFYRPPGEGSGSGGAAASGAGREAASSESAPPNAQAEDLARLRAEVESLRRELAAAQAAVAKGSRPRGSGRD
jgi:polyhydroxyalkanoate synthesis repressor PhaR